MSVFDNFDKIANMYPEVYGERKSQKRYYSKNYLKSNPDSDKMKIYEAFNDLYKKYEKYKDNKKAMRNNFINNLTNDFNRLGNENYLLKKEIEFLKKNIN